MAAKKAGIPVILLDRNVDQSLAKAGEDYVVLAWPIAREGRKEIAGVALFDAEGRLIARGHQVWIVMAPRMPMAAAANEAVSA